uniref:Gibberellic acid methyltransferase n=1 Tax=Hevea brasiliensis TaxID=3981 RepID=A0A894TS38_HEVBR|nr:gibberellic acid methyltransferase [Hevea brasiliensis]
MNSSQDPNSCFKKSNVARGGGLHRVLCMQGGDDDSSYAKNSEAPASAISLCRPLLLTTIESMKIFFRNEEEAESLRVADLGCATGYNTLATVDMVVEALRQRYINQCGFEPEFEAFFSDLPSNDFNSLFRSLSNIGILSDNKRKQYYAAGVPGSFYGRLFPRRKLHVAVSLSALHWLSQIPDGVLDKRSAAWNKGRVWIDGAKKEVVEAYAKQSEKDLEDFLKCRKEEIVQGGMLFLLMGGRPASQQPDNQLSDPDSRAKHPFTTSLDQAWQDLINEGMIDEETRDGFNIPAYMRSTEEVERAIRRCGGFEIERMEYSRIVEHSQEKQKQWMIDPISFGKAKANLLRATLGPIIEAHLGPYLSHQLFIRFQNRVSSDISLLHKTCFYGVIVACAIRK